MNNNKNMSLNEETPATLLSKLNYSWETQTNNDNEIIKQIDKDLGLLLGDNFYSIENDLVNHQISISFTRQPVTFGKTEAIAFIKCLMDCIHEW